MAVRSGEIQNNQKEVFDVLKVFSQRKWMKEKRGNHTYFCTKVNLRYFLKSVYIVLDQMHKTEQGKLKALLNNRPS